MARAEESSVIYPDISYNLDFYLPPYLRRIAQPDPQEGFFPRSLDLELLEPLERLSSICTQRLNTFGEKIDDDLREVFVIQRDSKRIYWLLESRFNRDIDVFGIELSDDFEKAERPLVHFSIPKNHEEIDLITCSYLSFLAPVIVESLINDIKGGKITQFRAYERYEAQLAEAGLLPKIIQHYRDILKRS